MKLIVVSGACRGVGKTYIAMQLCEILGDSIYAKIGHGVKASSKPENFFSGIDDFLDFRDKNSGGHHQYCIIESNRHTILRLADVRIFIDAPQGTTDIRSDTAELKQQADIVITPNSESSDVAQSGSDIPVEKIPAYVSDDIPPEKFPVLEKLFRDQRQYLSLRNL